MGKPQSVEIPDHEILMQFARDDPVAFEAWRQETIEKFIQSTPSAQQRGLRGVQFRVECIRRCSRSALGATVKIYGLMWQNFIGLNNNWQGFRDELTSIRKIREMGGQDKLAASPKSAKIFEFRRVPSHRNA